jgi:hypothetical protein
MPLSVIDVIAIATYSSIDVNGTELAMATFNSMLSNIDTTRHELKRSGMYHVILQHGFKIRDMNNRKVLASLNPRYCHHNKQPPACTCKNSNVHSQGNGSCKMEHSLNVIFEALLGLWEEYVEMDKLTLQSSKKKRQCLRQLNSYTGTTLIERSSRETSIDKMCRNFTEKIVKYRNGCAHVNALSLFQALCMFSLIPPECIQWSSIASPTSGGYKLLEHLLQQSRKEPISQELHTVADVYLIDAQKKIEKLFEKKVPLTIIENMLCELWREHRSHSGKSSKKDLYFQLPSRKSQQCLFRYCYKNNEVGIEMLCPMNTCKFSTESKSANMSKNTLLSRFEVERITVSATSYSKPSHIFWDLLDGESLFRKGTRLYVSDAITGVYESNSKYK